MRVTVLQLDTQFPRIAGDVASPATYQQRPEILRLPRADVASIVRPDPENIDIAPFVAAAKRARGDVITTSCGFLAPFEAQIAAEVDRPFVASSLNALPQLQRRFGAAAITVLTFDAEALGRSHFPAEPLPHVIGIGRQSFLYRMIAEDLPEHDPPRAEAELLARIKKITQITPAVTPEATPGAGSALLLLECTNLPPFKQALRRRFGVATYDILDRIEAVAPGAVRPAHL